MGILDVDKRKQRSIAISERELSFAENVMNYYRFHSISEVIRYLIIRENALIEAEQAESAGKDDIL